MKLKSSTLQLSLIGCLSFLHLTSHAGQLSPSPNNLSSSAVAASSAKNILRPPVQKDSISNKLNPSVNFNELYSNVKSGKAATTKIEGGIAAGGGAIILYPDKHTGEIQAKAVEIYQITEGTAKSKFTLDTGPGQTLQEKIDYVLHRLSKASGLHAEMYGTWIQDILTNPNEADDFSDVTLPRVEDLGVVILPPGGVPVQVFIQQVPGESSLVTNGPSKRYLWNKKLFYSLDLDSQVALLFHEVIYRDYREVNKDKITSVAMNSQKVQYVTATILSKEIEKYFIDYKTKERYYFNEPEGNYNSISSNLFSKLLQMQGLGNKNENLIKFSILDEVQSLIDPTKLFHYVDCESILKNTVIHYKNYKYARCPKDIPEYNKRTEAHKLFDKKLEEKIQQKLQFNMTKERNLDFLGFEFHHNYGISYLYKTPNNKNIEVVMNSFQDESEIDLSSLRNQIFANNLGFKIYVKNELGLNIHFNYEVESDRKKFDEKFLLTRGSKTIKFEFDNIVIEASCGKYFYNYPVCFISNENKLENIKIFNVNGQLLASQLTGKADLRNKDLMGRDLNYSSPLERFQIFEGSESFNLKEYLSKEIN